MTIGNIEDAKLIYNRRKSGYGPIPKGWRCLGNGAYRTSYLSPDRVVYKVCFPEDDECHHNMIENQTFKRIRTSKVKLPRGWRVAKTKLYSFFDKEDPVHIIAMEYVEGTHPKFSDDEDCDEYFDKIGASRAYSLLDLYDLHEENFLVTPAGKKVIIDLGE